MRKFLIQILNIQGQCTEEYAKHTFGIYDYPEWKNRSKFYRVCREKQFGTGRG